MGLEQCAGQWFHIKNFQPIKFIQKHINVCSSSLSMGIDILKSKFIQAKMIETLTMLRKKELNGDLQNWFKHTLLYIIYALWLKCDQYLSKSAVTRCGFSSDFKSTCSGKSIVVDCWGGHAIQFYIWFSINKTIIIFSVRKKSLWR